MFTEAYCPSHLLGNNPTEFKAINARSLPKKKFTEEDDQRLINIIASYGTKSWGDVAAAMGDRNPRQCKERWENYLSPDINNSPWTKEEDDLLIQKQLEIGSKWVTIAKYFDHRTDAQVKNRWQLLSRKMKKKNITSISYVAKEPVIKVSFRPTLLEMTPSPASSPEAVDESSDSLDFGETDMHGDWCFQEYESQYDIELI